MTSAVLGIILALLIGLLIGGLIGYALVQSRTRKQTDALKLSQRRLEEMEQSHELRLREATSQLRSDYEAELAETIEHYQDQLSQKTTELEQIYQTRFQVLQQGETAPPPAPQTVFVAAGSDRGPSDSIAARSPQRESARRDIEPPTEPAADNRGESTAPEPSLTQPELLHLKKQYEMRLKEAAQKLQRAYEKQLAEHVNTSRADMKADYERQLAEKVEEIEQQFDDRRAELEAEYANRAPVMPPPVVIPEDLTDMPTPSQIMGTGDDTTVTLPPSELDPSGPSPEAELIQQQVEERLEEEKTHLKQDYDQRLASELETQQEQFDLRIQDLEAEYKQKMAALEAANAQLEAVNAKPEEETAADDDLFDDDFFNNPTSDNIDFGPLDLSDFDELT